MQALIRSILTVGALLGAPAAQASGYCFEIHDAKQLVYRSTIPPVDMSKPISQGMAEAGRAGQHLTFRIDTGLCESFGDQGPSLAVVSALTASTPLAGASKPRRAVRPPAADMPTQQEYQAVLLDAALTNVAARNPGSVADLPVTTGRTIYTGPRGGRYYVTSTGNKQYVSSGRRR